MKALVNRLARSGKVANLIFSSGLFALERIINKTAKKYRFFADRLKEKGI